MTLSPSSIYYIIFGLLISGISSCLTSLNFWVTEHNPKTVFFSLESPRLMLGSPQIYNVVASVKKCLIYPQLFP